MAMDTFIATTDIVIHRRLYAGLVGAAGRKHGLRSSSWSLPRQLSHRLPPLTNSSQNQQFVVHRREIVLRTQWMVTLIQSGTVVVLRDACWNITGCFGNVSGCFENVSGASGGEAQSGALV